MKKIIVLFALLLGSIISIAQPVTQRGTTSVTVQDARLFAQYNFRPPVFPDTTSANTQIGLDSCGALIFSRDINAYYYRACSPKRWVRVASGGSTSDSAYLSYRPLTDTTFLLCRLGGTRCDTIKLNGKGVTQAWLLGGNTSPSSNNLGTISTTDVNIITNDVARMKIAGNGINRSAAARNRYLMIDTSTRYLFYGDESDTTAWKLAGNSNAIAGSSFVGTTNNVPLEFRIKNVKSGIIDSTNKNVGLGFNTLKLNTPNGGSVGTFNVAVGHNALSKDTFGFQNVAVGGAAMGTLTTNAQRNVAIGYAAMNQNRTPSYNVAVGWGALPRDYYGSANVAIGADVANFLPPSVGDTMRYNTMVGYASAYTKKAGTNNVFLGDSTGALNQDGSRNVFIGSKAGKNETGSDKLYIANSSVTVPLIKGDFADSTLIINGMLAVGSTNKPDSTLDVKGSVRILGLLPSNNASDSMLIIKNDGGVALRTVPTGTIFSLSQGYGIANSPNPITSTGTITTDTSVSGLSGKYLRIVDTTNKFVNNVTKLNDSTITIFKGNTSTNIVLPPSVVYTENPIMSRTSGDSNIIYFNADTANVWRGGGGGSQNLQQVTDLGNTTTNALIVDDALAQVTKIGLTDYLNNLVYPFRYSNVFGAAFDLKDDLSGFPPFLNGYSSTFGDAFYKMGIESNKAILQVDGGSNTNNSSIKLTENELRFSEGGNVTSIKTNPSGNSASYFLPMNVGVDQTLLADAPNDGSKYARQNGTWVSFTTGGGTGTVTDISQGYGIIASPTNPITTSGTIDVDTTTSGLSGKYLRIVDTTDKWVNNISRTLGKDSIIFFIGSTRYAIKDSSGGQNLQQVTDKGATTSNNILISDGATQSVLYKYNSIEFRSNAIEPNPTQTLYPSQYYFTQKDTLPTGSGVLALSVNGVKADSSGNITMSTTGGGIAHGTATGTDTYAVTIAGVASYADGDSYLVRFTNGNTTGATLNINSIGAVTLYRNNDGAIIGGDITSGGEMLCIYNSTLGGFQLIGTSPNTLLAYITNAETTTITKGQVVYAFGGTGDRMTVKLASNSGDATSAQTVGVVLSTSIAANQKGLIVVQGLLDGLSILPTATYADGDPLYLGSTAGSITNVKPSAPSHLVYLGNVTTASNGSAGRWYVRIQNGYELQELHNVALTTPPNNNDGLFYETSTSLWKNKSIATVLGYTPIAPADTSVFQRKSISANTIMANNTASPANVTAQAFYDVAEQAMSNTITFGGVAPTTLTSANYSWSQIGKTVTVQFNAIYTTSGTSVTGLFFTLPSDMPAPLVPTGWTGASAYLYTGAAATYTTATGINGNVATSYIRRNAANTAFELGYVGTGVTARGFKFTLIYKAQ
tara:strand:- start:13658 stop:17761 length:4104 start_codon:yes stop_codon:yes gene_type:complete